ncbi:hypothetical protein EMIT0P4_30148 [Pseudomonas sp. IT-P4]
MKCSSGEKGRREARSKDRSLRQLLQVSALSGRCQGVVGGVSGAFLQTKKKALQSKTFLNFGAPRETRTPTPFENGF